MRKTKRGKQFSKQRIYDTIEIVLNQIFWEEKDVE